MEILETAPNELIVKDFIKTAEDYDRLRTALYEKKHAGSRELTIRIEDAQFLNSSIIGMLLKIKEKDGVNITLRLKNRRLWRLFDELDLLEVFNIENLKE